MASQNSPRSFLVIVGGSVAFAALWVGSFVVMPLAHYSWTMSDKPVETTFEELATYGLVDQNTHLRLINVGISSQIPGEVIDDLLAPTNGDMTRTERLAAKFDQAIAMKQLEVALEQDDQILVFPMTRPMHKAVGSIRINPTVDAILAAYREVRSQSTLTGRFDINQSFIFDPSSMGRPSETMEMMSAEALADARDFVYSPPRFLMGRKSAIQWMLGVTMLAIAGMIAAGSGGPSTVCMMVFPLQALISMAGYPLRYRRGKHSTRFIYIAGGSIALALGGYRAFVLGNFGNFNVNITALVEGQVMVVLGLSAICGALFNFVAVRFDLGMEGGAPARSNERRLTYDQACGMDPTAMDDDPRYFDPKLSAIKDDAVPLDQSTRFLHGLSQAGFGSLAAFSGTVRVMVEAEANEEARRLVESGEKLECDNKDPLFKITEADFDLWATLGAGNMVSATIEQDEVRAVLRLTSVLGDGVPVMTLCADSGLASAMRLGTNAIYYRSSSNDAAAMLSEHLENALRLAEMRNTTVETLDAKELADVYQFCGRALADVQHQYGESLLRVDKQTFGRFVIPAETLARPHDQTVAPPATAEETSLPVPPQPEGAVHPESGATLSDETPARESAHEELVMAS